MRMDKNIDLLKLQFTDLFGQLKMVELTRGGIEAALRDGYAINRFALEGIGKENRCRGGAGESLQEGEETRLCLKPDPATLRMMNWEPGPEEVAGVICDVCRRDGTPDWADPRSAFKRVLKEADAQGIGMDFDFQCDFYLFHTDDEGRPTTITHEVAGYYDAGSIDLAEGVRSDIMMGLAEAGMEVESAHHGQTPGQHSFVLPVKRGIEAADYLGTFRAAVKRIARRHGLHATFMPKPNRDGSGSGLHVGITLRAAREDGGEEMFCKFRAGILRHLRETMIFTNPFVNSYKRLADVRKPVFRPEFPAAVRERGSDEAAGIAKGMSGGYRLEVLYPDPSANPYLALAALAAAGLDGIKENREVSQREEIPEFPETLGVALAQFEGNRFARDTFGDKLCDRYLEGRKEEWERFSSCVTDWEIREYLYRC